MCDPRGATQVGALKCPSTAWAPRTCEGEALITSFIWAPLLERDRHTDRSKEILQTLIWGEGATNRVEGRQDIPQVRPLCRREVVGGQQTDV